MSDKIKRYIDANALQAQLERKKPGSLISVISRGGTIVWRVLKAW